MRRSVPAALHKGQPIVDSTLDQALRSADEAPVRDRLARFLLALLGVETLTHADLEAVRAGEQKVFDAIASELERIRCRDVGWQDREAVSADLFEVALGFRLDPGLLARPSEDILHPHAPLSTWCPPGEARM